MPHALDTSVWATVTYLDTEVKNAPGNKIRLRTAGRDSARAVRTEGGEGDAPKEEGDHARI